MRRDVIDEMGDESTLRVDRIVVEVRDGTVFLIGVIAVGAWVFFYLQVPETKGKTLEQIEAHWRSEKSPRAL